MSNEVFVEVAALAVSRGLRACDARSQWPWDGMAEAKRGWFEHAVPCGRRTGMVVRRLRSWLGSLSQEEGIGVAELPATTHSGPRGL